jgi:hypothetical protein
VERNVNLYLGTNTLEQIDALSSPVHPYHTPTLTLCDTFLLLAENANTLTKPYRVELENDSDAVARAANEILDGDDVDDVQEECTHSFVRTLFLVPYQRLSV